MALRNEHKNSLAFLEKYQLLNEKAKKSPPNRKLKLDSKRRDPDAYVYEIDPDQGQVQCMSRHDPNNVHVIDINRDDKDCGC